MMRRTLSRTLAWTAVLALSLAGVPARAAEGLALFGEPKYGPGFRHLDYVNPDAPKGGRITLSVVSQASSFDKLNPFSLKGRPAPGLLELTFETLTVYSLDEPNTQYGLLAEDIALAPDLASVTFRLRPEARFSDGTPVTGDEVAWSFARLTAKEGNPRFRNYFSEIAGLDVVDARTVRFRFKRPSRELAFVAGSLPVFSPGWGRKADGSGTPFEALQLQPPLASGPYTVERASGGLNIVYRRNPDYWARDLPIRRGMYNFDVVTYQLYRDADSQVAALRGGGFDFFNETRMRYWVAQYIGPRFDSGELVKLVVPHRNPAVVTGWVFNQRRERFRDPRVRQALAHAFDFEWQNDKIFEGEFRRITSFFNETPLQATGLPGPEELRILEPLRGRIPDAVFGPMIEPPRTEGQGGLGLRANLARALELFAAAGWTFRDGALRNAAGEPFEITLPASRGQSPINDPFEVNLRRLGITVRKDVADPAVQRQKLGAFDFDYAAVGFRESRNPANELWRTFNSRAADTPGSENLSGLKDPVIDDLIRRLRDARTQEEQIALGRSLDRVLMHSHAILPWRYLVNHYLMFNRRLQRPAVTPTHFSANEWALGTWWDEDAANGAGRP
jgi:microcin C transport system substrate-binding protein